MSKMKAFITEHMHALFKYPLAWGPPAALEAQLLLLVEMWHVAEDRDMMFVHTAQIRFIDYCERQGLLTSPVADCLADRMGVAECDLIHQGHPYLQHLQTFAREECGEGIFPT